MRRIVGNDVTSKKSTASVNYYLISANYILSINLLERHLRVKLVSSRLENNKTLA
jgi:hypothetical protein